MNKSSPQDGDATEPWIGIWTIQMTMLGYMLRGSTPVEPTSETDDPDPLVKLFGVDGLPPDAAREVVFNAVGGLRAVVGEAPRNFSVPLTLWLDRHEPALKATAEALASFYERHSARVRSGPLQAHQVLGRPAESVFEAIFAEWIANEKPLVLQQAVHLMIGSLLSVQYEPAARAMLSKLFKGLHALNKLARELEEPLDRFQSMQSKSLRKAGADPLGFSRLASALQTVRSVLKPFVDETKLGRGRRPDPLKSFVVERFRMAGLLDRDIAAFLGTKKDAVRKQARRAAKARSTAPKPPPPRKK